jgi:hypothetical protein
LPWWLDNELDSGLRFDGLGGLNGLVLSVSVIIMHE